MRTICLTGGTGFVGSHLLELLEQEPEVKVKVLSRKQADMPYHADHVQVFLGDLLDSNSLVRFLEPDSITINLAYMSNRLPEDNIEAGLNLVYVGNVAAAIRFLMFTDREINKQCYIVSDDEAEENNYCDVVRLMTTCLGRTLPRTSYFKSPSSILSTILGIIGRSNTNPYRIYSCDKLLHLDFRKPVSFMEGLQRFADWYKRTIVGAEQV